MLTREQREERSRERKDKAFDQFLSDPLSRMAMSMIPAGENSDALRLMLRSAFDKGYTAGGADIAIDLVEGFIKKDRDER